MTREQEERITAAAVVDAMGTALGLRREDLLHGSLVIGDFLGRGYSRLAEVAGAEPLPTMPGVREAARATAGGTPLTLVRMPFGAPAAAMVMETYAALGAHRFLILGAAGSLQPHVPIGSVVVPTSAVVSEGTSRHYGARGSEVPCPSPDLAERLAEACRGLGGEPRLGRHWTTDAPYRELVSDIRRHAGAGVLSVDMEVSALFSVARFRGVEMAAVLAISDEVHGPWNPGFASDAYQRALDVAAGAAMAVAAS